LSPVTSSPSRNIFQRSDEKASEEAVLEKFDEEIDEEIK